MKKISSEPCDKSSLGVGDLYKEAIYTLPIPNIAPYLHDYYVRITNGPVKLSPATEADIGSVVMMRNVTSTPFEIRPMPGVIHHGLPMIDPMETRFTIVVGQNEWET